ncbi:hypothetical protein EV678_0958 [Azospira oryzae]|uniref:Uncharacterized protein n=1 Tax=Azospira oryzae TaxID=146939 RepID=A0ABY0ISU8_9RHOO|nr:hypothetical protein [Azospira oryzae]RZT90147.1 hypothetical protein EV678_0958 [Azospira oryzae]
MAPAKLLAFAAGLAALAASTAPAQAGIYSDDMAKCLVRSTTPADRASLVKWMFSAMALHPDVKSMARVEPAQREGLDRNTANLIVRLMTETCRSETQQALTLEGPQTVQQSFQVLGQVAARELFSNPDVMAGVGNLGKYVDPARFKGMAMPAAPQNPR